MKVPTRTKVYVGFWVALSALWILIAVGNLFAGDNGSAFDAFCSASLTGLIAILTYERDEAREFRRAWLRTKLGGRSA